MRSGNVDFDAVDVAVVVEEESGVGGGCGWKDCGGCNRQKYMLACVPGNSMTILLPHLVSSTGQVR